MTLAKDILKSLKKFVTPDPYSFDRKKSTSDVITDHNLDIEKDKDKKQTKQKNPGFYNTKVDTKV
jgi:hypothetical protein